MGRDYIWLASSKSCRQVSGVRVSVVLGSFSATDIASDIENRFLSFPEWIVRSVDLSVFIHDDDDGPNQNFCDFFHIFEKLKNADYAENRFNKNDQWDQSTFQAQRSII